MAKADCSELSKALTDLAMATAAEHNLKTIDEVVFEMQKDLPDIRRESLVAAINEATTGQAQEVDAVTKLLYDLRQEARGDARTRNKIDELAVYLEKGTLPPKAKARKEAPDVIKELREIRDGLRKQLNKSAPAQKERLKKSIAELEKRIETGDIMPKVKAKALPQNKEIERLQYNRDMLRHKIQQEIHNLKPKSIWEHIATPFNTARSLITSIDLSAMFRQGGFITFGNPARAAKAVGPMLKAFASQRKTAQINNDILNRDNAPLYAKSGLYLAPVEGTMKLSEREEAFMTSLAEKIPGVAASGRAYTTYLNKLRADSFDTMVATLGKNGEVTIEEAEAIAKFINVATGRGSLGGFEKSAVALNTIFFAPKYAASRFQLLGGAITQPIKAVAGQNKRAHRLIVKEYAKYLIGMSLVYALAKMAGGDVEDDPRSSDFGKIRIGNTRIDPLSGLSQTTVLLSRLASGETKSVRGVRKIRGDVPYGAPDTSDFVKKFFRYKLSPMFGTAANVLTGESAVGEEVTPGTTLRDLTIPLSVREVYESIQEQGVPKGTALSMLAILGMGLQTYGKHIDTMTEVELQLELDKNTYKRRYKRKDGEVMQAGDPKKGREDYVKNLKKQLKKKQK